jgi:YgiT-type zinc finger domain-containing protein
MCVIWPQIHSHGMHCKGRMVRGTAPFNLERNGYHVSWDAIPAWVCTQCGESFFEWREVDLILEDMSAR